MKQTVRIFGLMAALSLLCAALCGCGDNTRTITGFGLNTVVSVTVFDGDEASLSDALVLLGELERRLSRTVDASEIARANRAGGAPTAISDDTAELLRLALSFSELSGGKFDITVCPASSLWDFGAAEPAIPSSGALSEAVSRIGYEMVSLSGNTLTLSGGAELDLGGIAKGYIADRIAEQLKAAEKERAIVNLGGNVVVFGGKADGTPFTVGIQKPFGASGETALTLCLTDGAVATSGTYERCFTRDGILYHHILDPETGMPASTGLSSVTVITGSSAEADALSTVCFLLGETEGMALIEERTDTEAVFIREDGSVLLSSGLSRGDGFVTVQ
ncbi:MAG: FAD:protein FMN transferase [Clostridia bacterium]|nr:FAD:protein FMN transferase [Clostridia bacterium]